MLAYNHGPHIGKAIESVLAQEGDFPVELLIGEDHSTDNTLAIAREYEQANPGKVRVITSAENVGMMANLRRLETACSAKYIAYCEADDYWHDRAKLKKQVTFLEENPDYVLCHTEYRSIYIETGKIIPNAARQPTDLNDADGFDDILSGRRLVLTLTACIRASVLHQVLAECSECYDSKFLMADTQRWLELVRRGKVKCLHEVTATHLLLSESASQSKNPKRVLRFVLSSKFVLDYYINKYGCRPETKVAATRRTSLGVLSCAYAASDGEAAKKVIDECRSAGISLGTRAALYNFGSRSPRRRQIAQPCLVFLHYWGKAWGKIGRLAGAT